MRLTATRVLTLATMTLALVGPGAVQTLTAQDDGRQQNRTRQDGRQEGRGMRGGPGGFFGGFGNRRGGGFMRGLGPLGAMLQPEFLRRDLVLMTDALDLDAGQQSIAEMLLLDYEASFAEAADAMRERGAALRPERPEEAKEVQAERETLMAELREIRNEIRQAREQLPEGEEFDRELIATVRAKMAPIRERMTALRPAMPRGDELDGILESYHELADDWKRERNKLAQRFLTNLQAILNDEQTPQWSPFRRALRRSKALSQGRLSAESVDLFLVLRELEPDAATMDELDPVLEAYAIALHDALGERDEIIEDSRLEFMPAMMNRDFDTIQRLMVNQYDRRERVRDTNEQYRLLVDEALVSIDDPKATADEFETQYRREAYPRIYGTTWMQRSLAVALDLPDLNDDAHSAIDAIATQYAEELARTNETIERLTREHEASQATNRMQRRAARTRGGERPEDPIRNAYGERRELESRYRAMLEGMLTPEQVETLPEARSERQGRGGRERGGDRERRRGPRAGGDSA